MNIFKKLLTLFFVIAVSLAIISCDDSSDDESSSTIKYTTYEGYIYDSSGVVITDYIMVPDNGSASSSQDGRFKIHLPENYFSSSQSDVILSGIFYSFTGSAITGYTIVINVGNSQIYGTVDSEGRFKVVIPGTGEFSGSYINFGGYVYDVTTGTALTTYTITIETAMRTITGTVNSETGKFLITGVPSNADYIVNVTAENYVTFKSSHDFEGISSAVNCYRVVGMIPTTAQTPAITVNVTDSINGSAITATGLYRLDRGAAVWTNLVDLGSTEEDLGSSVTNDIDAWVRDNTPIYGTFSGTSVAIAAGSLLFGYPYTLTVYNVSGYQVNSIQINPYALNASTDYNLELLPDSNFQSLRLLAVSNLVWTDSNLNGVLDGGEVASILPIGTGRTITFYFNQNIELDSTWNQVSGGITNTTYRSHTELITALNDVDNTDNDDDTNTLTLRRLYDREAFTGVVAGNYVLNISNGTDSTVETVVSTSELLITNDIFNDTGGQQYAILNNTALATGTTDGGGGTTLIDSTANFTGVTGLAAGDYVRDSNGNFAEILSVDSATQLTLDTGIMGAAETYSVYNTTIGSNWSTRPITAATWLTAAVSGNTLTLTLAADATILADGTYDAGDDLSYTIDLQYFNIRPASVSGNNSWTALWGFTFGALGGTSIEAIITNTIE